ncbi:MAG: tRNA (adenosine(37)-N6)-dimethylallyltransferase MiaA [Lachnospiraceae bacterium]|nr:tRNA (adenosine(37)-N6)-dimethylallyltransferase MiaA [Lachnospiraceae bacterium]
MKRPLIIITGPTASGKTATSVELALRLDTEIISADSMQVYRYMDVGTAKVTKEEMRGVVHHLIDVLDPKEDFNISIFQTLCKEAMEKIYAKGKIPMIVGGTGFYIQSILKDVEFDQQSEGDERIREELKQVAEKEGNHALWLRLFQVDEEGALAIPENNVKRVIRGLEYFMQTGEKISVHNAREAQKESPYQYRYYVIHHNRDVLYDRINRRVDVMIQDGLVEEVKRLKAMGCNENHISMKGIGYKEILAYLDGMYSLEDAIEEIKKGTRHFAKRQITWFKREESVLWRNYNDYHNDVNCLCDALEEEIRSGLCMDRG